MQLIIAFKAEPELILPINHHHILQSVIYEALESDDAYGRNVHDGGYTNGKRKYKLFQFGQLKGNYRIDSKKILFSGMVTWEIRSVIPSMITILEQYYRSNGINFGSKCYDILDIKTMDRTIKSDSVVIKMNTPVTVHSTDGSTKKTYFPEPDNPDFLRLINDNFMRKYEAYTGKKPEDNLTIQTVSFREKDKYVTRYKNFYISGWFGIYRILGNPQYIDFLYQTGLGERNSQGFGMFEILKRGVNDNGGNQI